MFAQWFNHDSDRRVRISTRAASHRARELRARGRGRGFTLIELLAVMVIISLVAGLATISLASTTDAARLRDAASRLRDLDGLARTAACTTGEAIVIANDAKQRVLHLVTSNTKQVISTIDWPTSARVQLRDDRGAAIDLVSFDRLGRSADYRVELLQADREIAWTVFGLTGYIADPNESGARP